MRHILNNIVKLVWFIIFNILFPTLIFAFFIILENSLLIQTNSTMFNFDFANYKGSQLTVSVNTSFCNNLAIALIVCVDVFSCLKITTKFISKKINVSYVRKNAKILCDEISAYNVALSTSVSYLRI